MVGSVTHSLQSIGPQDSTLQKLSVDEFYALSHQQLAGTDRPVELVHGEVCRLSRGTRLAQQTRLLQHQIQSHLDEWTDDRFEARLNSPIRIDQYSELKPALAIVSEGATPAELMVHWVIDIMDERLNQPNSKRSHLFAKAKVVDYWTITVTQSEARIHQVPTANGYQHCQLLHTGSRMTPLSIPQITLSLQEPFPLYFLTRTLAGQHPYESAALPLHVCLPR